MDIFSATSGFQFPPAGTAKPTAPAGAGDAAGAKDAQQAGVAAGLAEAAVRGVPTAQDAAGSGTSDKKDDPGKKPVEQAVKDINDFFQNVRRTLQFSLDQDSGKMVIQIKDAETNEVVRQIPPEYVLKIAKQLGEVKGLLFEEKA